MLHRKQIYLSLIILFTGITSCQKNIDLQGFDMETWKKDSKGCSNQRLALWDEFDKKIKPQLKGLSEKQIYRLLGKADRQELSKRNQKFYYYYLETGNHCDSTKIDSSTINRPARRMQIRFDGINNVNEIVIVYN